MVLFCVSRTSCQCSNAGSALLLVVMLALAACTSPVAPDSSTAMARPVVAAGSTALPGDHADTPRYKIAINYPPLGREADPLSAALHEHAAAAKRQFLRALPDAQQLPEFANRQFQLLIGYTISSRTAAFVSVRGRGMMDTGGAHPIPLDATFVFDALTQRLMALDDLFIDPQAARRMLAGFARRKLEQDLLAKAPGQDEATPKVRKEWQDNMREMIDAGTQPTEENFAEFQIDPDGLLLVFPPYQVAPYVYGTQIVAVPLKVFAAALKPAYRDAFIPAKKNRD